MRLSRARCHATSNAMSDCEYTKGTFERVRQTRKPRKLHKLKPIAGARANSELTADHDH